MHPSEHKRNQFSMYLSGAATPFPYIYDAISEQILLLILKARKLNEDTEFSKWFSEQHQALTELRSLSNEIRKIFNYNNYLPYFYEQKEDSIMNALIFMQPLYTGFDEGKVSLQTWGEMNGQQSNQGVRFAEKYKLIEKFVHDDLFAILVKGPTFCTPISPEARKGYCHQDLSIAHSCSNELLSRLNDFHKIDSLSILAEAIYKLITDLHDTEVTTPDWLSEFKKGHTNFQPGEIRQTSSFHKIIKLINEEGRNEFIDRIAKQSDLDLVDYLLHQYMGIYAAEIMQWVTKLQMYFNNTQSLPFTWKFTTVMPDIDASSEAEEKQQTVAWESDYCQISIKRDTLLKLIQANALHDAADTLADCLLRIYGQPADEMRKEKGAIPQISEQESCVYNTNSYHFNNTNQVNYKKCIDKLHFFEEWYENNKVLLIKQNENRTSRISVEVRLAGLKCYDLKMGLLDGNGMKFKDGIYNLVKQDSNVRLDNTISDMSLQRYYSDVKKIIKNDIDALLLRQRKSNSRHPFNGAINNIKPLWSKSENHEEE
ncbi:TPA: hypothetical protein MAQ77_004693 [Klebsiella pneumoniae]|nr:hypothetical protein [Klebsiella pneumoniae]